MFFVPSHQVAQALGPDLVEEEAATSWCWWMQSINKDLDGFRWLTSCVFSTQQIQEMEFTWCFFWCILICLIPISVDGCSSSQVLPSFEAFLQDPQLEVRWSSRGRMSCVSPRILQGANLVHKIQWLLNEVRFSGGFWKSLILELQWSDFSNLNFARCVWQPSSLLGSSRNASQFAGCLKQPKGAIFSDHQFC